MGVGWEWWGLRGGGGRLGQPFFTVYMYILMFICDHIWPADHYYYIVLESILM